jgi:hypothetical protein
MRKLFTSVVPGMDETLCTKSVVRGMCESTETFDCKATSTCFRDEEQKNEMKNNLHFVINVFMDAMSMNNNKKKRYLTKTKYTV